MATDLAFYFRLRDEGSYSDEKLVEFIDQLCKENFISFDLRVECVSKYENMSAAVIEAEELKRVVVGIAHDESLVLNFALGFSGGKYRLMSNLPKLTDLAEEILKASVAQASEESGTTSASIYRFMIRRAYGLHSGDSRSEFLIFGFQGDGRIDPDLLLAELSERPLYIVFKNLMETAFSGSVEFRTDILNAWGED